MCGSSSPSGPTSSTTNTSNIPEYAKPYVETMLGATQKQLFDTKQTGGTPTYDESGNQTGMTGQTTEITGMRPFQAYGGTYDMNKTIANDQGEQIDNPNYGKQTGYDVSKYFAGWQPLQERAFGNAANMGVSPQTQLASDMATQAGLGGLAAQYNPAQFANQFQAPGQYQSGQFGAPSVRAQNLQNFQMGPAEQVSSQSFTAPGTAEGYMNPYMQNVVNAQQREATRASDIMGQQNAAAAVSKGAFGGSRQGLVEAERQRNLATQLGDIQATGQQAAFNSAQQQFNQEQQARMQAQQANQQAGLSVGQQNLAANLGVQNLGASQNLQAQQLNQAARLQAQQAAEQSRQFGAGQGLTAAQLQAQYGLSADQAQEASRQFSANYGLQGLSTSLNAANQLGTLGQNQYGQQTGIIGLQNQLGTQQQQLEQNKINQQIQDYATQQQWGMQQLANMNAMLRGLPLQNTTTQSYQAAPSAVSQLAGLGTTAVAGAKLASMAKGGKVNSGIDTLGMYNAMNK